MPLSRVVDTSAEVTGTRSRLAKIAALSSLLGDAAGDEIPVAVAYLSGELPQGSIGVGWASIKGMPEGSPAPSLALLDVDATLSDLQATAGKGSQIRRRELLENLFRRATRSEQGFLARLLTGELRQGALEGIMVEAVARAAGIEPHHVRRAQMLAGDLRLVARVALTEGREGLDRFTLEVGTPLSPMLAQSAESVADAMERTGDVAKSW